MKMKPFKLVVMSWLLFVGNAGEENDDPLHVYVKEGGVAVLNVRTNNTVKYARMGSPKSQEMNTEKLYLRVAMENGSLVTTNNYGVRLQFRGSLSHGANFTLSQITMEDNNTKLRIIYQELCKAPKTKDFIIIVLKALASDHSPSAIITNHSSGNTSDHPAVHRTVNTTETQNDMYPAKTTPAEPLTPLHTPSGTVDMPGNELFGLFGLFGLLGLLLILAVVYCFKKKIKEKQVPKSDIEEGERCLNPQKDYNKIMNTVTNFGKQTEEL